MHDFFNILTVAILLPIKIMTGIMEHMATKLSALLYGGGKWHKLCSPKSPNRPPAKAIKHFTVNTFGEDFGGTAMIILRV